MPVALALVVVLAFGLLAAPPPTEAQQPAKIPRIGVLSPGRPPLRGVDAFRRGLSELGYIEGRNIALEIRWACYKSIFRRAIARSHFLS